MPTIQQLKDQGLALVAKQKALLDDGRPWTDQKRAEFSKVDADVRAVVEQVTALQSVDGRGFDTLAGRGGGGFGGRAMPGALKALAMQGVHPIAPPRVDLSPDQGAELYDAAVSGKSLTVVSKAVDSTAAPMGAATEYRLAPTTFGREPQRVLSLLPTVAATAPSVTWYAQTTASAAATSVGEGAAKPQSNPAWTSHTTSATKLAHYVQVTDEMFADFGQFIGVVQQDLVAGLINAENAEILNATVAGASKWPGLLNTSGILTRAKSTEIAIDTISMAFDDLRTGASYLEPDGIVMHPSTWGTLRRLKDGQSRYYLAPDPSNAANLSLWDVPVVLTTQIAAGTVLVGAFGESVVTYVREGIRVETGRDGDDFTTNRQKIRAEERLILTVPRPTGLVKVTGL